MTAERDVNRLVKTWLEDGVTALPERVLDEVLAQVPSTRQERRGFAPLRNESMQNAVKLALVAAAVIAVVVAGMNLIPRSNSQVGGPTPSDSPSPLPSIETERITMRAWGSPVTFSVDKPTAWGVFSDTADEPPFSTIRGGTTPPTGMSVYFYAPTTTYQDPCREVPVDPPIGPTVDDLVQALREIPNITTTEPVASTLGGLPATYLEMTTDGTLPCSPSQFYIWDGNLTQGAGQIVRTWVLEVNGSRIVASALRYPDATDMALAEQQIVLDSIQFE
jgi:hypothetical protein